MKLSKSIHPLFAGLVVFSSVFFSGCDTENTQPKAGAGSGDHVKKPIVAVTIVPQKTFVEAVCGDLMEVITLVPPGNSPANYQPTPELMTKFQDAAVYFSIGVPTEKANILPNVDETKVVNLRKRVEAVYPERTFPSGGSDPHIWLSPKRVVVMVKAIAEKLSRIDPTHQSVYEVNAASFIEELQELDLEIQNKLGGLQHRKFIVYHPAFGYFADDYDLEMLALEKHGKAATAQQMKAMVDTVKAEQIKVIFYQKEIDNRQSRTFAEEIGGVAMQLSPLAENYVENLREMTRIMAEVMQ